MVAVREVRAGKVGKRELVGSRLARWAYRFFGSSSMLVREEEVEECLLEAAAVIDVDVEVATQQCYDDPVTARAIFDAGYVLPGEDDDD